MPETIKLADGTEREVPTQEESEAASKAIQEAETLRKANETFSSIKTELGIGENDDPVQKLKELKESQNPNWAKVRAKMKAAEIKLEEAGFKIDDEGVITKKGEVVNVEDVISKATEAGRKGAEQVLANKVKESMFGQFADPAERKTVETIFDRLMEIGGDIKENFEIAVAKTFPDRKGDIVSKAFYGGSGGSPLKQEKTETKIESSMGRNIEAALNLKK